MSFLTVNEDDGCLKVEFNLEYLNIDLQIMILICYVFHDSYKVYFLFVSHAFLIYTNSFDQMRRLADFERKIKIF